MVITAMASLSWLTSEAGITEEDPVFELIDHERDLTYGVQEILTPQQAAQLLQEHGQPPE